MVHPPTALRLLVAALLASAAAPAACRTAPPSSGPRASRAKNEPQLELLSEQMHPFAGHGLICDLVKVASPQDPDEPLLLAATTTGIATLDTSDFSVKGFVPFAPPSAADGRLTLRFTDVDLDGKPEVYQQGGDDSSSFAVFDAASGRCRGEFQFEEGDGAIRCVWVLPSRDKPRFVVHSEGGDSAIILDGNAAKVAAVKAPRPNFQSTTAVADLDRDSAPDWIGADDDDIFAYTRDGKPIARGRMPGPLGFTQAVYEPRPWWSDQHSVAAWSVRQRSQAPTVYYLITLDEKGALRFDPINLERMMRLASPSVNPFQTSESAINGLLATHYISWTAPSGGSAVDVQLRDATSGRRLTQKELPRQSGTPLAVPGGSVLLANDPAALRLISGRGKEIREFRLRRPGATP